MLRKTLVSLVCMAVALPTIAFADDQKPITVFVDGQQLNFEVSPVIQNGTTLVPIRAVFEKLGLIVSWDTNTSTISGKKDGLNIQMIIGNTNATVNGRSTTLDVPPSIIQGNTLVPLRFVGEASGNEISWNGTNQRIDIKKIGLTNAKVVSRAEVSRFLVRSLGLYDEQAQINLMDVSVDNAYYRDISSAMRTGIMSPYEDGSFRPNATIMRVEYAVILAKILNLSITPSYITSSNSNSNIAIKDSYIIPLGFVDIVQAVINAGLMDLNEDGTFDGNSPLAIVLDQPNMKLKDLKEKNTSGVKQNTSSSAEKDELAKVNNDYSYFKSAFKAGERQLTQSNFILSTAYYDGALNEDNFFKYWDGLTDDLRKSFMLQYTKEIQNINPQYTIRIDFYYKKDGLNLGTCTINLSNGYQGAGVVPNPRGLQNGIK